MPDAIETEILYEIQEQLHDLCQPLSALQCRLEIAQMDNSEASFYEAIRESLEETRRVFVAVDRMRRLVNRETAPPTPQHSSQNAAGGKA